MCAPQTQRLCSCLRAGLESQQAPSIKLQMSGGCSHAQQGIAANEEGTRMRAALGPRQLEGGGWRVGDVSGVTVAGDGAVWALYR